MPKYQYQCCKCKHNEEITQSITDPHLTDKCPDCGADRYRTIGVTHFIAKGPGFHNNDYC